MIPRRRWVGLPGVLSTLLGWTVLRARSDSTREIEILSYATSSPCFNRTRTAPDGLDGPDDDLDPHPTATHASTR
jgi:hypothetical protein